MAQSVLAWSHSSSIRWFTEAGRKRKLVPFGKGLFAGVGHFAGYHLPGSMNSLAAVSGVP